MRAANDQLRVKLGSEDNDISTWSPAKWRERWPDPEIQRLFIENFIYIRAGNDPAGKDLCLLKLNDVQVDYHLHATRRDVILKARQQGFSTYILAKKFAKAVLFSGTNVRIVPHDTEAEDEFRNRLDVMYENLPQHLQPATKYYSKGEILFHDSAKGVINSSIRIVVPSPLTKAAKGRGLTLTDLHLTEVPFWKGEQRKTLNALLTAAQHGEITVESTAQGMEWFFQIYSQGKDGSEWKSHFYEWWWTREYRQPGATFFKGRKREWVLVLPGDSPRTIWSVPDDPSLSEADRIAKRDRFDRAKLSEEEIAIAAKILKHLVARGYVSRKDAKEQGWHQPAVAEYIAWRRKKASADDIGPESFRVEYPSDDTECFENTGRTVISPRYLKVTCSPQGPIEGHRYVVAADTSLGTQGSDPAAIEVLDLDTGNQVHSESLLRSPDLLAYRLAELSDLYNWALIAVERNNTGIATLRKLNELVEDERIHKELTRAAERAVDEGKKTYDEAMAEAEFGIATTTANKAVMGVLLEIGVRTGEVGLSSEEWCTEARTVVWINSNSWEAMKGFHDDKFIALAIANYVRVQAMKSQGQSTGAMPATAWAR